METKIVQRNNRLFVESMVLEHFKGKNENELVYLKNGLFKVIDYPNLLKFEFADGKVSSVTLLRDDFEDRIEISRE